jgi:hypothetical protein
MCPFHKINASSPEEQNQIQIRSRNSFLKRWEKNGCTSASSSTEISSCVRVN